MTRVYARRTGRSALLVSALALGACAAPVDPFGSGPSGYIDVVPPEVLELAAPGQDLSRVQLRPDDSCFWYLHAGPVEDTMIPLRTEGGNPICLRKSDVG